MYLIRKINGDEVNEAIALAFEVFMQFEAPDYSPEGVDSFKRDIVENEEFIGSCKQGIRPIYAAFDGDKIIGIMGMRPNKNILVWLLSKRSIIVRVLPRHCFIFCWRMCGKIIRPLRKSL